MRRIIGTIVGAIVAVSLAVTSVGSIVATLKTFLIIGLIATRGARTVLRRCVRKAR